MRARCGALLTTGIVGVLGATSLFVAANSDVADTKALSAGAFTTSEQGAAAYAIPVAGLSREQTEVFAQGKEQFNEAWVVAPDPGGVWGLGPTFNEDRCSHCHENNGRARAPADRGLAERGYLVRLSIPGQTPEGAPMPHPVYGDQLQNRGIADRVPPEGAVMVTYQTREVMLGDGEKVALRVPKLEFKDLQFGDLGSSTMTSPRIAPAMIGMGLLEAVPEQAILQIAKDQQALGFRGTPNYVWDYETAAPALGRFGWKANQPSIRQQTAAAFHGDIGATTYMFPEENCPSAQKQCLDVPSASKCGGQGGCTGNMFRPEVIPSRLSNITLYLQALAVPARRNVDDEAVKRGEQLFAQAQCAVCHVPQLKTGPKPALSIAANLTFHAYTDLLLHDLGEDLADHRPDFKATGTQWRTAPLWSLGLLKSVNGHSDLLHDGRARTVTEAILWHGGEAEKSREAFRNMPKADREALVKFVESL
ncbi:MAG TPA: di-heme oxidoredictase family protein [Burkholderiales bacterium]|nr:di-heme oxidoredictase family protein [Burkholderiales bacterium]